MKSHIPILNTTLELADYLDKWFLDETYHCWCLEDILYTLKAATPKFQRMSIFVPETYLNPDGTVNPDGICGSYTAKTAPVIFENNSAGYMQMPHTWLGGPRDEAPKHLQRGMVYVTCGSRGWESRNQKGELCGKSPWTLIDLKTGIRFLRHNVAVLPGDMGHMISVGWSAGGAMSALISVTGDHPDYLPIWSKTGHLWTNPMRFTLVRSTAPFATWITLTLPTSGSFRTIQRTKPLMLGLPERSPPSRRRCPRSWQQHTSTISTALA